MKHWKTSVGLGSALVLAGGTFIWADANADALRSAPAAVQSAVTQLAGTNKIHEFGLETEGGKTAYDLEYQVKGESYEADIDPSGQILSREVEVDLSIIPPAVLDAAKKAHADGKLDEASIVAADGKLFYEIDVKVGNDSHELHIAVDGTVMADSIEAPEAQEKPDAGGKGEKGEKGDKDGEHEDKD
jgi:uncharacterized membrane protein YkoI